MVSRIGYPKALQAPHLLTRNDLAEQVRKYVVAFNLNVITSAKVKATQYNKSAKRWIVKLDTPAGMLTAVSKQLVQATGIGSQKPNMPSIADRHLYKGISLHSAQYTNAKELREKGAKVSANTFTVWADIDSNFPFPVCHRDRISQHRV